MALAMCEGRGEIHLKTYRPTMALAETPMTVREVALCVLMSEATLWRSLLFYSDATHVEPERSVLALAENFALALTSLAGLFGRTQHKRLLGTELALVTVFESASYAATVAC